MSNLLLSTMVLIPRVKLQKDKCFVMPFRILLKEDPWAYSFKQVSASILREIDASWMCKYVPSQPTAPTPLTSLLHMFFFL